MKDGYHINIALNGRHYCHVELGRMHPDDAPIRAAEIAARFPASEGFSVSLSVWQATGQSVQF